ncbi:MAG TPA: hypothetical protein VH186_06775 [Chloroflexia bacterium]|nr:hypothetical protein [Chloroflexia bacterium]
MLPDRLQEICLDLYHQINITQVHLLPRDRLEIYDAINEIDGTISSKFHKFLAIKTADFVLPIWTELVPGDDLVPRIFEIAKGLLNGSLSKEETAKDRNLFYLASGSEEYIVGIPQRARAVKEVVTLVLKIIFDINPITSELVEQMARGFTDETMIELGTTEVATPAVLAYSGFDLGFSLTEDTEDMVSPENIDTFEPEKRLEFWKWWLTEAIPQAWELAQQSVENK